MDSKRQPQRHLVAMLVATVTVIAAGLVQAKDFRLTSPDVTEGQPIVAAQYANSFGCTGANARPVLKWSGAPAGTKSFAVTLYDKDAPTGSGFWHWVVTDIPASATGIAANAIPAAAMQGNNDAGQPDYLGPCPPVGREHAYVYTVHALDTAALDAPDGATAALAGFFIYQHSLDKATLLVIAGPRDK